MKKKRKAAIRRPKGHFILPADVAPLEMPSEYVNAFTPKEFVAAQPTQKHLGLFTRLRNWLFGGW